MSVRHGHIKSANHSAERESKKMTENGLVLEALKQSNYFLKQYAGTLSQNDSFIVLKQYAENIKIMREIAPERSPEERAGFLLLHGEQEQPKQAPEQKQETFSEMLLRYGVVNEYQIRNNSKEIKALRTASQGLSNEEIEAILKRVEAYKAGASNLYGYLVKCFKNAKKESANDD